MAGTGGEAPFRAASAMHEQMDWLGESRALPEAPKALVRAGPTRRLDVR